MICVNRKCRNSLVPVEWVKTMNYDFVCGLFVLNFCALYYIDAGFPYVCCDFLSIINSGFILHVLDCRAASTIVNHSSDAHRMT